MDLDLIMLFGSAVVLVAIISSRVGARLGLPSLLLFLGLGMALSGVVTFDDADLGHQLGFAALVLILAEGGLTTRWSEIKGSVPAASLLATLGIAVSTGLIFCFAHFVLGLDLWVALLLGAVCSPTDSAAVFSVLRKVPLPGRIRSTLEAESGLNDAPTVLLVAEASRYAMGLHDEGGAAAFLALVFLELLGGVAIGAALGWLGAKVLHNIAFPSSGLHPLATLVWAVLAYGIGVQAHTSGFAAVYVCAVILGNANLPHRQATRSFVEGIGWVAQIGLFVMLGLLVDPTRIDGRALALALALGLFATVVARPASLVVCLHWFKVPFREQVFLSWAGLRGAVPIILATIPLAAGVGDGQLIFDVVLIYVIVFTLLQAPTLPWMARRLRVLDDGPTDVEVEAAPMERIHADLLQIRVPDGSQLSGVLVSELRLPRDTVISLVIRDGQPFAPHGGSRLHQGDELLIVTPSKYRSVVEQRLRDVGQRGRLARWRKGLHPIPEED